MKDERVSLRQIGIERVRLRQCPKRGELVSRLLYNFVLAINIVEGLKQSDRKVIGHDAIVVLQTW